MLITRIYECIFFLLFYVRLTRNNRFTCSITKARIYMLANFNLLFVNNRYLWPSLIGNAYELSFTFSLPSSSSSSLIQFSRIHTS